MTLEVVVFVLYRVVGALPILRWPFAGALLSVVVDLLDLLLVQVVDLGGVPDYQALDKYLDQVPLAFMLVVAVRRWDGVERQVSVGLYAWRLVGFLAFEVTHVRELLLLFPNVFEFWFIFVAGLHAADRRVRWTWPRLGAVLLALTLAKEVQEWALHAARLFDQITFLDAVRELWRWLTGGRI